VYEVRDLNFCGIYAGDCLQGVTDVDSQPEGERAKVGGWPEQDVYISLSFIDTDFVNQTHANDIQSGFRIDYLREAPHYVILQCHWNPFLASSLHFHF